MFKNLFSRKMDPAKTLYEAIVAAARQPRFYTSLGVADTVAGRFDLLILHLYLVVARLKTEAPDLCQKLIDQFCQDMDGNLREMGVGDLGVGKKVRRMAEALTGRMHAYDAAETNEQLIQVLNRNLFHGVECPHAPAMALWVNNARTSLANQATAEITSAKLNYP